MRRSGSETCKLPVGFRIAVIFLAILYFVSNNYLTKRSQFVRAVVSIDRQSGAVRWICEGLSAAEGQIHLGNSVATPTPVTDGERIYVYFGSAGLLCTNLHGKVV